MDKGKLPEERFLREVLHIEILIFFVADGKSRRLPDLCFLQLIRTVNPELYDWTEHCLTERAVVASGEGAVSEAGLAEMVSRLGEYSSGAFVC